MHFVANACGIFIIIIKIPYSQLVAYKHKYYSLERFIIEGGMPQQNMQNPYQIGGEKFI